MKTMSYSFQELGKVVEGKKQIGFLFFFSFLSGDFRLGPAICIFKKVFLDESALESLRNFIKNEDV